MGLRIGNWLTVDQSKTLLGRPPADDLRGKRDRAILALLIGFGLRRAELVGLGTQDFQVREERWVIADLIGTGKHIRTVPVLTLYLPRSSQRVYEQFMNLLFKLHTSSFSMVCCRFRASA
jgi:site-specific recombinase XerD